MKGARGATIGRLTNARLAGLAARHGTPLLVIDCEAIRRQYRSLSAALPGVGLFYALKPLPNAAVVATLRALGAGFDVATTGEIELIRAQRVAPGRCIHTHPIKRDADIRAALSFGIRTFVADNPDEIRKFERYRGQAELLLRVSFRNPAAVVDLSRKFGCEPGAVPPLLELARKLGVRVIGLSFHVGSQVADPGRYVEAIDTCRELMLHSAERGLAPLEVLDIGGGFPIPYGGGGEPIARFCRPIRRELATLPEHVRVIAEPGRFIAGPAGTCITAVTGRAQREGRWWYYLDDGLYGSFSGQLYDHALYPIESLGKRGARHPSVLAGPTCDSIDVIREDLPLPQLELGDLLVGRMMGAYTSATASDFNFIPRATVVAVNQRPGVHRAS
ncbi:MAG: ornithine decarboxylase [Pseudomonadota bacterium]|jgi:ornithine decarboxylase|nr:ornithine decarboxylase [Pseudomonadota bacterium]MDQ1344883.1 ornithine decarboxylase [Pseudomonadota bacterium]